MRRFRDTGGQEWEVTLGRASWGAFLALFIPVEGEGVREAPLAASSTEAASRALLEESEEGLASLLDRSTPRTP